MGGTWGGKTRKTIYLQVWSARLEFLAQQQSSDRLPDMHETRLEKANYVHSNSVPFNGSKQHHMRAPAGQNTKAKAPRSGQQTPRGWGWGGHLPTQGDDIFAHLFSRAVQKKAGRDPRRRREWSTKCLPGCTPSMQAPAGRRGASPTRRVPATPPFPSRQPRGQPCPKDKDCFGQDVFEKWMVLDFEKNTG